MRPQVRWWTFPCCASVRFGCQGLWISDWFRTQSHPEFISDVWLCQDFPQDRNILRPWVYSTRGFHVMRQSTWSSPTAWNWPSLAPRNWPSVISIRCPFTGSYWYQTDPIPLQLLPVRRCVWSAQRSCLYGNCVVANFRKWGIPRWMVYNGQSY